MQARRSAWYTGRMRQVPARVIGTAIGALALALAASAPASAQEAPRPEPKADLLFKLNQSLVPVESSTMTKDDLRRVPPPRVDKIGRASCRERV